MKIEIWTLGQESDQHIKQGESMYLKRINQFVQCQYQVIKTNKIKSKDPKVIKSLEASLILDKLKKHQGALILLDEKGKQMTSKQFSGFVEQFAIRGNKEIIFLVGGSYGFDQSIYDIAIAKLALSQLTFPHQLVRLIFLEQLYRAYAIINRLPYHHE